MGTRNITLALPEKTLRDVKVLAAKRGTSVSAMLRERLEALVLEESDYERARQKALAALEQGFDLGTHGQASWTRDELHER